MQFNTILKNCDNKSYLREVKANKGKTKSITQTDMQTHLFLIIMKMNQYFKKKEIFSVQFTFM